MEIRDDLALVAEIGIAVAGFLSIFLVLAEREGRLSSIDKDQILTVVSIGFMTTFNSLTPLVLDRLALDPAVIWRGASGVSLLLSIPNAVYFNLPDKRRQAAAEAVSIQRIIVSQYLMPTIALLVLPLLLGIVFGAFAVSAPGVYLLTIVLGLGAAAMSFMSLVFDRFT